MLAELEAKKTDGSAIKMWDHMMLTFGNDWKEWPMVGCGAGFAPFRNGPSMLLEMEVNENEFVGIVA